MTPKATESAHEDDWLPTYELPGPVCPFGHPWDANDQLDAFRRRLQEALMYVDDAIFCLAVGEGKSPRPDTATNRLRKARAALGAS